MKTRIKLSLNDAKSIDRAIQELERYKVELYNRCVMFVDELAKLGIETGKANCGEYGDRISFSREATVTPDGAKGRLIAVGDTLVRFRGSINNLTVIYDANALLLAEFGSGWEAKVLDPVPGLNVGQGTFPDEKHAFDPDGWYYLGEDGVYHHSYGETPTHPMHAAMLAMIFDYQKAARKAFRL